MTKKEHSLVPVESADHWDDYHSIRSQVLFKGEYDPDCPDDRAVNNQPLLFFVRGRPVGAMRVDRVHAAGYAIMRTVAILQEEQRQGYGAIMLTMAEDNARDHGFDMAVTIADNDAVSFYKKCGYVAFDWDVNQLDEHGTQMKKELTTA